MQGYEWRPVDDLDHYLIVKIWSPKFIAEIYKIDSALVWIRFPSLNMLFFYENFLLTYVIGKPTKVDMCSSYWCLWVWVTSEPELNQIDLNSLGWVIYVFWSKLNITDQNRSCTGWIADLDLKIRSKSDWTV